jgi:hypothetical protein
MRANDIAICIFSRPNENTYQIGILLSVMHIDLILVSTILLNAVLHYVILPNVVAPCDHWVINEAFLYFRKIKMFHLNDQAYKTFLA